jgi:hypothetical protein
MNRVICVSALIVATFASGASAESPDPGFYVGLGAGTIQIDFQTPQGLGAIDDANMLRPFVGYQFDRTWGLELSYLHVPKDPKYNFGAGGADAELAAFTAQGVGRYQLADTWYLLGTVGVVHWNSRYDEPSLLPGGIGVLRRKTDGTDLIYGLGGGINLGAHDFRLVYEKANIEDDIQPMFTFSYSFRF